MDHFENLEKIKKDWDSRGFSCEIWTDPPGQVWENFTHLTDELIVPLEGNLEIEMMGKKLRPKVGEETLIPANVLHTVRNKGDSTAHWLFGYKKN